MRADRFRICKLNRPWCPSFQHLPVKMEVSTGDRKYRLQSYSSMLNFQPFIEYTLITQHQLDDCGDYESQQRDENQNSDSAAEQRLQNTDVKICPAICNLDA